MKIILTGGGTAGHINPALSIAKSVMEKAPNSSILFIGKVHGMEENLVKKAGFDIKFIDIAGFNRKKIWKNLSLIRKIISAVRDSKKIIKNFAPDAVIGTGGYVCGPVLYAAKKMKIPTIIHESNAIPGVTTKITSKFATATCLGFEEAKKRLKSAKNIVITGNPVRPELFKIGKSEARKKLKLDDRPYILTFGGSLGAAKFNEAVSDFAINAAKSGKFQILMGVGKNNDATKIEEKFVQNGINLKNSKNVKIAEYIEDMDVQMNAADVVICRAGAITVSEILVLKKPAILVPSPNVTHNHQEFNAQTVVNAGFGVIIHENELNSHAIEKSIENFLENSEKSLKIEENVGSNALDKIYSVILSVLKK